ncbi:MAG: type II secretion system F family protein [Eubacterium sp.]|nr:type II secretion system F family protein [Eubacterium sp.]
MSDAYVNENRPKVSEKGRFLGDFELAAFCSQIAMIVRSGIPVQEGLKIMLEDAGGSFEKTVLENMAEKMDMGTAFSEAAEESGVFPPYFVNMVRIGEEAGSLDSVLTSLEAHYKRESHIRVSIRNAVIYPVIMAVLMIAVLVVLLVYVMPVFKQVFTELGTEMNGLSLFFMDLGILIRNNAAVFLIIAAAIVIVLVLIFSSKGKKFRERVGNLFAGTRAKRFELAACRFAGAMSTMLHSGLHMDDCLKLAGQMNEDEEYGKKIEILRTSFMEKADFAEALSESGVFTGIQKSIALTGYRTGALDECMGQISDMYRDSLDKRLSAKLAVVEPAMVITLCLLVGLVLLSVMFPLLGTMTGV